MKVVGLLNFFNEQPALLFESVSRVCALGVSHVVALDGPYALYPYDEDKSLNSSRDASEAIVEACNAYGSTGWVIQPGIPFQGNEVEKRNTLLHIASSPIRWSIDAPGSGVPLAQPNEDWFLVFDADHMWQASDYSLVNHLDATTCDVAEVAFGENKDGLYEARLLVRNVPGLKYEDAHWRMRFPDGRTSSTLRAGGSLGQADTLDLRELFSVYHAVYDRPEAERARQAKYYEARHRSGAEQ